MFRLTTFNVLSTGYCTEDVFPSCDLSVIDSDKRWEKLENILVDLFVREEVICLQEVCHTFRERLEVLHIKHGYRMICRNYGNMQSNFMGVATLFPDKYSLEDVKFVLPSMYVETFFEEPSDNDLGYLTKWFYGYEKYNDKWYKNLVDRQNTMLVLTLCHDNVTYKVCNYHAPCVYYNKTSQLVVAACLLHCMNEFEDENLFLCSDLNIKPYDKAYSLIRTGRLIGESDIEYNIQNMNLKGISSSHVDLYGEEPSFTCKSISYFQGEPNEFEGCLDYIFYRSKLSPKDSRLLPENNELLPNKKWPSDHKMLSFTYGV